MIYEDWNDFEDASHCLEGHEEEASFQEKLEILKNNVIKAFKDKEMDKGSNFETNNNFSVQVDRFADFNHHVYRSIVQDFVKECTGLDPKLWKWIVKDASSYMDQVYCIDRTLLISHPDFLYPENPYTLKVQFKASGYDANKQLLLPIRKSIEHLNQKGNSYIQPRELSLLNNIDVFIWYHWCPIKHDVVIHALKEPRQLFRLLQIDKKEIAGKPVRYGDDFKKVDMLYLNPTAEGFPNKENLIFVHNPFLH